MKQRTDLSAGSWSVGFFGQWSGFCRSSIFLLLFAVLFACGQNASYAAESGDQVIVVYNSSMPESKEVAEYYAKKRNVPSDQVVGFPMPTVEAISRADFRGDIQRPLSRYLDNKKLFTIRSEVVPATNDQPSRVLWRVKDSKIRYAVLCYGVPSRIMEDPAVREPGVDKLPEQLRRNSASVDSELSLIPMNDYKLPLTGIIQNSFYNSTEPQSFHPTNGILMVARLDGPTAAIA
ncbi:MAG: TIGR03790 family protein, partial [Limisphaerales bacterium]